MATPDIHIGSGSKNSIERKLRIDSNSGVQVVVVVGRSATGNTFLFLLWDGVWGAHSLLLFFFFFRCGQPLSRCRGEAEMGQH